MYNAGPPKKRGELLTLLLSPARMKFDYALGSLIPAQLKEHISHAILNEYCPKEVTVCHTIVLAIVIVTSLGHQLCSGCTGA